MKRILILTDSLGLPRAEPQLLQYESTWPYLVKKNLDVDVLQASIGAATSSDLLTQVFYYKNTHPDIVFVQCGIVDLSPRAFLPHEIALFKRFRLSRFIFDRIIKRKGLVRRIRKMRKLTYTSKRKFERNLMAFKDIFGDSLYWITVPQNVQKYNEVVPGIVENIHAYNMIIKKVFNENIIDVANFSYGEVMSDFHHLKAEGHMKLFKMVTHELMKRNAI